MCGDYEHPGDRLARATCVASFLEDVLCFPPVEGKDVMFSLEGLRGMYYVSVMLRQDIEAARDAVLASER